MSVEPFCEIAEEYDRLNDVISFGMHRKWKKRLVELAMKHSVSPSAPILDVSAGTGDVSAHFRKSFRDRDRMIIALDPCKEMVAQGRGRLKSLSRLDWTLGWSESLPFRDHCIGTIACAFGVRNFSDLSMAFREWNRVLVRGGTAAILEVHPIPRVWYRLGIQMYWSHVLPQLGRLWGHESAYKYLRDTSQEFLTVNQLIQRVCDAGFKHVATESKIADGMVTVTMFKRLNSYP